MYIGTVLVKLSFSLLAFSQLLRLSSSTSMSYTLQFIAVKIVSSAQSSTSTDGQDRGRSLIYIRNNNGPRMEPWGTPVVTLCHSDKYPFASTL